MGGGPASADVVRASCLLTFPEGTMVEPVPVDAWYLHAVGLTFLRRLARDRLGDAPRIALILQRVHGDQDGAAPRKRYVSVSNDAVLRDALRETFQNPERVLVLHVIALDKVLGQKTIHVTPEINPNVSPEPVAPLAMVFPTLAVENAQPVPEALALSSSFRLSQSAYDFDKPAPAAAGGKQLAHSDSWLDRSQEFGYAGMQLRGEGSRLQEAAKASAVADQRQVDDAPFALAAAGAQLIADRETVVEARVDSSSTQVQAPSPSKAASSDSDGDDIPMARVVGHVGESDAPRIPSDYVMLELQHGAGMGDVQTAMPATSASTFFLSPNWHLHSEELSASMRLRAAAATSTAVARPISEWSALTPSTSNSSSGSGSVGTSMEDSFVMLDAAPAATEPSRRRVL